MCISCHLIGSVTAGCESGPHHPVKGGRKLVVAHRYPDRVKTQKVGHDSYHALFYFSPIPTRD